MTPKGGWGRGGRKKSKSITMVLEPGNFDIEGSMARHHVLQIGTTPAASSPTLLMSHNFPTSSSWGVLDYGATEADTAVISIVSSIESDLPHSGLYCAQIDYTAPNNLQQIRWTPSTSGFRDAIDRTVYISYWFRYHSNWPADNNDNYGNHKLARLMPYSANPLDLNHEFINGALASGVNWYFGFHPSCTCGTSGSYDVNPVPSPESSYGVWHQLEMLCVLNTNGNTDGEFYLWIDGNNEYSSTSVSWMNSGCDPQSNTYKWGWLAWPDNVADTIPGGEGALFGSDDYMVYDALPEYDELIYPTLSDDFEGGNLNRWDDNSGSFSINSSSLMDGTYCVQRVHTSGQANSGSLEVGFADNGVSGYDNHIRAKTKQVTVECKIRFSAMGMPTNNTTKVLMVESWPGTSYPARPTGLDFQAILEVNSSNVLVVTIKREDSDFSVGTFSTGVTLSANTDYLVRMRVELDEPYTSSNGVLKVWVNDVLKIDETALDLILTSRGSDLPNGLNMVMLSGYDGGSGASTGFTQYWDAVKIWCGRE